MTQPDNSNAPVVLITGAGRRIGARIAMVFHQQGYRVIIHCKQSLHDAEALALGFNDNRPDSARVLQADLCDISEIGQLAHDALDCYGHLNVLVNNASSFYRTDLGSITAQNWDDLMASNAQAPLFLCQAFAKTLRANKGSIVNLTDMNINKGMSGFSTYTMAKAALQAMTRSLARELAPQVRVNAVSPGAILWPEHASDPVLHAAEQADILAGIPLARLGTENDIARAVYFLAHDAHYITGQTLRVDGGRALG
ncbi:MAG: pteridine reductase [Pseudohongiella sp.]|nr:pteridine reductase [Pseudohongiella sp.]MDP2128523.1 pteridine reductase [Pseudohongiella sp.]